MNDTSDKEGKSSQRQLSSIHRDSPKLYHPPQAPSFSCLLHGAMHANRSPDPRQLLHPCRKWRTNRLQLYNPSLCKRISPNRDKSSSTTVGRATTHRCLVHNNHNRNRVGADRYHCRTQGASRYHGAPSFSQMFPVHKQYLQMLPEGHQTEMHFKNWTPD